MSAPVTIAIAGATGFVLGVVCGAVTHVLRRRRQRDQARQILRGGLGERPRGAQPDPKPHPFPRKES